MRASVWRGLVWLFVFSGAMAAGSDAPWLHTFSPQMTEMLARRMYVQDEEADKATDVLFAAHPVSALAKQGFAGWVVVTADGGDTVRFLRRKNGHLQHFYDVRIPTDGAPVLSRSDDGSVSQAERAQFQARHLAAKTTHVGCTEYFKTIALKNPQGEGWLVWMLPVTRDKNAAVLGGDARYTISEDGRSILHTAAFSDHCTVVKVPVAGTDGGGSVLWTYQRALYPSETQAFFSLSYQRWLFESTPDGRTWRIRNGHIAQVFPDADGADGVASRRLLGAAEYCMPIMEARKSGKKVFVAEKKTIPLTAQLENSASLQLAVPQGENLSGIACHRNNLLPLPNDYKVLQNGVFLIIDDVGAGHVARVGMLSAEKKRIVFKLSQGPALTPDLSARMQARITELQAAMDKAEQQK